MLFVMPWQNFSQEAVPMKYDYSKMKNWIVHPDKLDLSKYITQKGYISDSKSDVAVFFVHPTTYLNRQNWNQPHDDFIAKDILQKRILIHQAAIFSACCEIYVPHYRQATLYSFVADDVNKNSAFTVAYQDISNSFKYFNENFRNERPFILAGHSQGSMHALKLLKELRKDTQLYSDMVAAYLVGYSITKSDVKPSKVCRDETSVNCIVAWNSVEENGFVTFKSNEDLICVNPLSWNENELNIPNTFNLGGVGFKQWSQKNTKEDWSTILIEKNVVGAYCKNGNLEITNLLSSSFPVRLFSLHAYDYGLFFMNIMKNTNIRVKNYLEIALPHK